MINIWLISGIQFLLKDKLILMMNNFNRWIIDFKHKKSAALLLFAILGIVLFNNIKERKNLTGINLAVNAIFEDRLLPESYIFKYYELSENMHETLSNNGFDAQQKKDKIQTIIVEIKSLNELYLKTKLTVEENAEFELLQRNILELEGFNQKENIQGINVVINELRENLHNLSTIQIVEAGNEMKTIKALNGASMISLRFEIYIVIIIGLLIQVLIFTSKTIEVIKNRNENSVWN